MGFLITSLIVIFVLAIYVAYSEYKNFNKGSCPKCGKKLEYFDMDSQGGRGYCCRDCNYYTWVSYNFVDKNFKD